MKLNAYSTGEYFVVSNASLVTNCEDLEIFPTFNEMIEICKHNNWELDYSYK